MTRRARPWLLLLLGFVLANARADAQGFQLQGIGGGGLSEADLQHGRRVVVLWSSWSPRGKDIAERTNALARSAGSGVQVVAVNFQEDPSVARAFAAQHRFEVPVFLDGEGLLAKKYRLANLPGLLVLRDGTVVYQGRLPDDPQRVVTEAFPDR